LTAASPGLSDYLDNVEQDFDKEKKGKERKEKLTLFSDHNGSLLRRQPGARL